MTVCRKRSESEPRSRKIRVLSPTAPDPWQALAPLGDRAVRSATALAELAVQTNNLPELWPMQDQIAEAVCHELLGMRELMWRDGIKHGKWLIEQQLLDSRHDLEQIDSLKAQIFDLQIRHGVLEGKYGEALKVIQGQ